MVDTVLKRDGGFPDREAATEAAREDAERLKAVPKPRQVGRILSRSRPEPRRSLRRDCPFVGF